MSFAHAHLVPDGRWPGTHGPEAAAHFADAAPAHPKVSLAVCGSKGDDTLAAAKLLRGDLINCRCTLRCDDGEVTLPGKRFPDALHKFACFTNSCHGGTHRLRNGSRANIRASKSSGRSVMHSGVMPLLLHDSSLSENASVMLMSDLSDGDGCGVTTEGPLAPQSLAILTLSMGSVTESGASSRAARSQHLHALDTVSTTFFSQDRSGSVQRDALATCTISTSQRHARRRTCIPRGGVLAC